MHANLLTADHAYPTQVGSSPNKTNIKIQSASAMKRRQKKTYSRPRLVIQNLLNLLHDLRCQLGQDLQRLEVLKDLLRPRRPQNDGRRVGILRHPCERKCRRGRLQFYFTAELQRRAG